MTAACVNEPRYQVSSAGYLSVGGLWAENSLDAASFAALRRRALLALGLRRARGGGFGAWIPESSAGG